MNLLENLKMAFSSIRANRMRSLLTMLGMIIGIAAVVAISILGNGSKYQIQKSLEQFGTNRLMVYMNWDLQGELTGRDYLTDRDLEAIKRIEGIEAIAPLYEEWSHLSVKNQRNEIVLYGATPDNETINNVELLKGRFINQDDLDQFRQVIVVSEKDARELLGKVDVVGEEITLKTTKGDLALHIVGVIKQEENIFTSSTDQNFGSAFMPVTSIMRYYNQSVYYGVNLKVKERQGMKQVGEQVINILERVHRNEEKYVVFNLEETLETVDSVLSNIVAVLAFIAGIALLVGGIGIMNIMLVTVTERIREIGIKMAIGAKRKNILFQFLIEAGCIALTGGVLGILIGFLIGLIGSRLLNMPLILSPVEIVGASLLSVAVGMCFGVFPAYRASKLNPIDALRYE